MGPTSDALSESSLFSEVILVLLDPRSGHDNGKIRSNFFSQIREPKLGWWAGGQVATDTPVAG